MPQLSAHTLPQRARIERSSWQADGKGGTVQTKTVIAAAEPCRLQGATLAQFLTVDGQLSANVARFAWFGPKVDIKAQDIVTIDGARMIVQASERQADGVYRKALVIEEQPDNLA